jgi:hypothetical protein
MVCIQMALKRGVVRIRDLPNLQNVSTIAPLIG